MQLDTVPVLGWSVNTYQYNSHIIIFILTCIAITRITPTKEVISGVKEITSADYLRSLLSKVTKI